jgi:hypothetical protein
VTKRELIGSLEVVMQTRQLFALPDLALADELHWYQFKLTDSGDETYDGPRGTQMPGLVFGNGSNNCAPPNSDPGCSG